MWLTREEGKNGKLRKLLEDCGVRCMELPCIAAVQRAGAAQLPSLLAERWEWVAVASPEAARVLLVGWQAAGEPGSNC